jgi:hypothetical protein
VHKVATVVTAAIALLVVGVAPVSADVNPVPGDTGAGISVSVSGARGGQAGGGGGGGRPCTYLRANTPGDFTSELVNPPPPPTPGETGSWYFYECADPQAPFGSSGGLMWVPDNRPAVPPAVLAQEAYKFVPAPPPAIRTNPAVAFDQVVNVPTWLWVDAATWGPRSATASVPNESATVTAVPISVTWTMGDGGQVVCRGPGTPYTGGDPARPSPTCGYTYRRSSARQPGLRYPVQATTTWQITWTAAGVVSAAGTLPPLLRTSTTTLRVAEAQSVNS